ncbi:MAG: type II secretion system major pseudopilin GspG [Lentisphaeria bacterium]|jgi:general secretion pathway protein G|nr:type II secretion system major pseudopilin GspG [Lentisphaeria bacterium]
MKTQKQRRRVTPFTLIEVVVVIVILVTLASVATPMYMNYIKKSKIATAKTQIKLLDDALQQYKLDVGTYPSDLQGLMENIDQSEKWDGPYIKPRVPLDPWGGEYQYIFPGEHGEFDIYSFGADGQEGGEGEYADQTNWEL